MHLFAIFSFVFIARAFPANPCIPLFERLTEYWTVDGTGKKIQYSYAREVHPDGTIVDLVRERQGKDIVFTITEYVPYRKEVEAERQNVVETHYRVREIKKRVLKDGSVIISSGNLSDRKGTPSRYNLALKFAPLAKRDADWMFKEALEDEKYRRLQALQALHFDISKFDTVARQQMQLLSPEPPIETFDYLELQIALTVLNAPNVQEMFVKGYQAFPHLKSPKDVREFLSKTYSNSTYAPTGTAALDNQRAMIAIWSSINTLRYNGYKRLAGEFTDKLVRNLPSKPAP